MIDVENTTEYEIVDGTMQATAGEKGNKDKGSDLPGKHEGTKTKGAMPGEPDQGDPGKSDNPSDMVDSATDPNDLKKGDKFYGTVKTAIRDKNGKPNRVSMKGTFTVTDRVNDQITVKAQSGIEYKTSPKGITIENLSDALKEIRKKQEEQKKKDEEERKKAEEERLRKEREVDFSSLSAEDKVRYSIKAGINNLWMVGPAGCGKSTIARNVASEFELPYLCISCGIGTSAVEFVGYKYPQRESTKFAEYYQKPSVILIDEMTALDPAVAQVINAALANNEIETTTGLVKRHPDCIIIATSNTFGAGASRQYVANNQLDASTIDRFIGGIIEVDYSAAYESQYDKEVVEYVLLLRSTCSKYDIRRIASTRMIQAGSRLKNSYIKDWKKQLIINWSVAEKKVIEKEIEERELAKSNPEGKENFKAAIDWIVRSHAAS